MTKQQFRDIFNEKYLFEPATYARLEEISNLVVNYLESDDEKDNTMNFNVPVYINLNNNNQYITIHCSLHDNIWTCQCIKFPDAVAVNTSLQLCIHEVVKHVKTSNSLVETNQTSKEM